MTDGPNFAAWTNENLAKFAREAYARLQLQQEEIENEEKLFGCSYCDYRANYKGDVFKHQTRRHPGQPKNVILLNTQLNGSNMSGNWEY